MDRLRGERGAARARYAAQQLELAQRTHPRVVTLAEQLSPTARATYDLMAPVQARRVRAYARRIRA